MTYELIGSPRIEAEYSDKWETTMVCDVRREDGVTGDVWIVAGVPDYLRGTCEAAGGYLTGCENVRVFGDTPDTWCPPQFKQFAVGQQVEAGEGDDADTGVVRSVDGDVVSVGWSSGVVTTVPASTLGEFDYAALRGEIIAACESVALVAHRERMQAEATR